MRITESRVISNIEYSVNKLLAYFNHPFPFPQKKWRVVAIPALWVFLVVYILEPLELVVIEKPYKLGVTLFVSLITALVSAFVIYLFPVIFKKYFAPERWTRYKFFFVGIIISVLSVAPITFFIYLFYLTYEIKFFYSYFDRVFIWLPMGLFIGTVPTFLLYILTWREDYLSRISEDNTTQSSALSQDQEYNNTEKTISIPKSVKEKLELSPDSFIYAEAQGNYLNIHFMQDGKVVCETVRLTLSQMIDLFEGHSEIVRCHRAFLVNISYIGDVQKKDQKHYISLNNCVDEIPLSKTYRRAVVDALEI